MRPGESFHPSLLAFLFDWWMKRWKITEEVLINCTAFIYYVTLWPNARMLDWIIRKNYYQTRYCRVPIRVSQDGFMLRFICMFLGCDMPVQLVLSSEYDDYDRLEDRFIMYWFTSQTTKYVTFYAWTNRLTHFSTCNLPITAASLC